MPPLPIKEDIEKTDPKEEHKKAVIALSNMRFQVLIQEVIVKKMEELAR